MCVHELIRYKRTLVNTLGVFIIFDCITCLEESFGLNAKFIRTHLTFENSEKVNNKITIRMSDSSWIENDRKRDWIQNQIFRLSLNQDNPEILQKIEKELKEFLEKEKKESGKSS